MTWACSQELDIPTYDDSSHIFRTNSSTCSAYGSSDTAAMLVLLACSNRSKRSHTDRVRVSRHSALCLRFAELRSTIACKNAKCDNFAHRDREGKRTGRNETHGAASVLIQLISELLSKPMQAPMPVELFYIAKRPRILTMTRK